MQDPVRATDKALTAEELSLVQRTMLELREQALAAPPALQRQRANAYLVLAFRYGDGNGTFAPQRNDSASARIWPQGHEKGLQKGHEKGLRFVTLYA